MYLAHHGRKGQKWGIRNGPPYPIETGMKKGTTLYSVTVDKKIFRKNPKKNVVYTYRDDWDKKVYEGPFAVHLQKHHYSWFGIKGKVFVNRHEYKTLKNFKMPTESERINAFKDLYLSDKKKVVADLERVLWATNSKKYYKLDLNDIKTEKEWSQAYRIFHIAMQWPDKYYITEEYIKKMSKKYAAMVDDFDQGLYNMARDPVIVFKTEGYMEELSSVPLSKKEIKDNYKYVKGELHKEGEKVDI